MRINGRTLRQRGQVVVEQVELGELPRPVERAGLDGADPVVVQPQLLDLRQVRKRGRVHELDVVPATSEGKVELR